MTVLAAAVAQGEYPGLFREGFAESWTANTILDMCNDIARSWTPCSQVAGAPEPVAAVALTAIAAPVIGGEEAASEEAVAAAAPVAAAAAAAAAASAGATSPDAPGPAATSAPQPAAAKRKAQPKAKPIRKLSKAEIESYMDKRQTRANWVLEMCMWINEAREIRLAVITEWAHFNASVENVLTLFLAMEAHFRMTGAIVGAVSSSAAATETGTAKRKRKGQDHCIMLDALTSST